MSDNTIDRPAGQGFLAAATGAWCIYLVIDFLIHAVFLAPYWRATENYWLPPRELFRMIPLAYISFAIYCAALTWLLLRLCGNRPKVTTGLRFGANAGFCFGVISTLGSYSVFRMPISALVVWPVSLTLESAAAGAAAAWVIAAERPWRRVGLVFGATMLLFVLGIVIQTLMVPSAR